MKKLTTFLLAATTALFLLLSTSVLRADEPPNPGGGPGTGDLPVGGSAPVGSGLVIMIGLASAYAARKIWKYDKFN